VTDEPRHRTRLEVRFRDVDAFGHVNNAVFFSYVEQARIRYLTEALEIDVIQRLPLILARVEMDYRAPVFYGEPLEVTSRIDWIGGTSFAMSHQILAGDDAHVAADADTVLVAYDYTTSRPMPVPDDWRRRFEALEGRPLNRPAPAETDGARRTPAGSRA
jgi:acyl-CoA thioester hydrolase